MALPRKRYLIPGMLVLLVIIALSSYAYDSINYRQLYIESYNSCLANQASFIASFENRTEGIDGIRNCSGCINACGFCESFYKPNLDFPTWLGNKIRFFGPVNLCGVCSPYCMQPP